MLINENKENPLEILLQSTYNWYKLTKKVAYWLRVKEFLKNKVMFKGNISVKEFDNAQYQIFKYLQNKEFGEIINKIRMKKGLNQKDVLCKLNPFIDENNLLRVGGRIRNLNVPYDIKHPIILPGKHRVIEAMVLNAHEKLGHLGRHSVVTALRQRYHIIGINKIVKGKLNNCIICKKINSKPSTQIMSDLPTDRLTGDLPVFTNVGLDEFGPFLVSRGRGLIKEKRYGVIFSCLSSRACHIEMLYNLDTDAFINALRRFISRRGNIKRIRSDNGTNFVAAEKELKQAIEDWKLQQTIDWKFQPPAASHHGGHFERYIRTIRKVLQAIMSEQLVKLTDDNLNTLFCEIECIINNRPLTEISDDPNDLDALTPNHILTLKGEITYPPGLFQKNDCYLNRKWKQSQYLADLFWKRWIKEYIPLLQQRTKWLVQRQQHKEGDLILLIDDLKTRNMWPLARIVKTYPDKNNNVRMVDVKVNKDKRDLSTTILKRPITKIILLRREM